jgi:hypothetical protein
LVRSTSFFEMSWALRWVRNSMEYRISPRDVEAVVSSHCYGVSPTERELKFVVGTEPETKPKFTIYVKSSIWVG